ncbi:SDR family NAD(P)-dependent oxidoreductase [Paenibacillus sp. CGMCC 1.16610]|uniref:SDR family NAD(P)-dependent oxidoreductase n=1 Tax=Paenibacillus anseongense TaxID=2682845 RepID=A0ABW9ULY0_9BACL|nr:MULTISPECIES: SDR family NAD(P)-dependent oxidoreductase [Paenibacillus]MBA2939860.1 SDR family NAD(P)-dependent oxidoreductase [Paenibacillus sp. CGMCC 1.16610]MVQ39520.1 SDR family NAD(P)-dependent oxidoreductase [Paenibacillus anseongense]
MSKVWFITGTSTGFGRHFVEQLLQAGDRVVATARKLEAIQDFKALAPDRVHLAALDVTKVDQIQEAVAIFGKIDIVVNNSGYGLFGMLEVYTEEQIRKQFDVNVFGVLDVIRATLPVFKHQGFGHYINFSSFFGAVSFPPFSLYAASKIAVEGFSEAFAIEFASFGIKTTIVEPAVFATEFLGHSLEQTEKKPEYIPYYEAYEKNLSNIKIGEPAKAVQYINSVIKEGNAPLRLPVGSQSAYSIRDAYSKRRMEELNAWYDRSTEADSN